MCSERIHSFLAYLGVSPEFVPKLLDEGPVEVDIDVPVELEEDKPVPDFATGHHVA